MHESVSEHGLPRRRRRQCLGLAVATVGILVAVTGCGDDGSSGSSVALGGDRSTASCLAFSAETLAMFPVAFDGTVTEIDGDHVTFDVEHWYRGGEGDTVTATAPELVPNSAALVGGVGFEEGERYLVSADRESDRITPAVCGFTVTYSDETADVFAGAFGG